MLLKLPNIFTNDITITSKCGNLTASISDHFSQFCSFYISSTNNTSDRPKYGRSYKNFRDDKFQEELSKIDWNSSFKDKSVNDQVKILLDKINDILNVMAPIRKLTKRENRFKLNPWITRGILKSTRDRDKIHKQFTKETDATEKNDIFVL